MKNNPLNFFLDTLKQRLPDSLKPFQSDIEEIVRHILTDKAAVLNLVSRDEFEAQKRLLQEAQTRIQKLEKFLENQAKVTD